MREGAIEQAVVRAAKRHGWFVRKARWIGQSGCPDRFFAREGRALFIEFKTPVGRLSALQRREIARLRREGVEVHVARSVEEALRVLGITDVQER
jgi:hypothetical protein